MQNVCEQCALNSLSSHTVCFRCILQVEDKLARRKKALARGQETSKLVFFAAFKARLKWFLGVYGGQRCRHAPLPGQKPDGHTPLLRGIRAYDQRHV